MRRLSVFPGRARATARAFTLLEVMIATLILAMLTFTLYRFVSTTLLALTATTELTEERTSMTSLMKLLQSQLNDLPPKTNGAISGKAFKFHDLPSDELTWLCRAGAGLLTGAAPGEYRVTLALQAAEDDKNVPELGLRRELVTQDEKSDIDFFKRGTSQKYNWLPLMRPVAAIQIRYWDPRLNAEIQQWNDANSRPTFVHVRIWKTADDLPFDVILPVPSARLQTR